jgi:hypothetical protein
MICRLVIRPIIKILPWRSSERYENSLWKQKCDIWNRTRLKISPQISYILTTINNGNSSSIWSYDSCVTLTCKPIRHYKQTVTGFCKVQSNPTPFCALCSLRAELSWNIRRRSCVAEREVSSQSSWPLGKVSCSHGDKYDNGWNVAPCCLIGIDRRFGDTYSIIKRMSIKHLRRLTIFITTKDHINTFCTIAINFPY